MEKSELLRALQTEIQKHDPVHVHAPSGGVYFAVAVAGTIEISQTPEPSSFLLFGTGLLGMVLVLRKSLLA
jgi:PEP-CTERM motif